MAPVVACSDQQRGGHCRWACPQFLRQTSHEWALHSIAHSEWAQKYYHLQLAKGKRRNTAIRALAFKWIRILFRCWQDRKPYDELAYQHTLLERRPVHAAPAQSVELQWKSIAGFWKIKPSEA